jgi:5-formaminoimidazole-4-carboxamide-1-(beta)-D-ribofuranosyl 5'-monophosphate synthetase
VITKTEIDTILGKYDHKKITVGTIGSHSALNIFKGAKEEGFKTVCVCKKENEIMYKRFPLADQIIRIKEYTDLLDETVQQKLKQANTILVPHGSFWLLRSFRVQWAEKATSLLILQRRFIGKPRTC